MSWYLSPLIYIIFFCRLFHSNNDIQKIQISGLAQGTTYHITYYAPDSTVKKYQVDSILTKLDSSMSIYKPWSEISRFNASANGITIDEHFIAVIKKSIEAYQQSDGVFDITIQPLVKAWGFGSKTVKQYPDSATVKSLLQCIGSDKIKLKGNHLIKTKPCITVDVNGIAQGYSVDVVAGFLEKRNVADYIVEIGGEIRIKGTKKPGNEKMKIGIEAPGDYEFGPSLIQKIIALDHGAVTTSGSYRQFHESKGKKFSHIIDTKTGYPSQNDLISVTVFADDAITADAYDNVLMALGLEKGLSFVEKRNDMSAYFIYRKKDGSTGDTASTGFKTLITE